MAEERLPAGVLPQAGSTPDGAMRRMVAQGATIALQEACDAETPDAWVIRCATGRAPSGDCR